MSVEVLSIIKAVAPFVTQIATSAIPAFTSKAEANKTDPVVSRQIEELQVAVTRNAETIHLLAENLKGTIKDLEGAALAAKKQIATYKILIFCSLGLSVVALSMSFFIIIR
jgi:hypothetical protein